MENAWEHITLNQFKAIRAVTESDKSGEDKLIAYASVLSGLTEDEILRMPFAQVAPLFEKVRGLDNPPKRGRVRKIYKIKGWELCLTDATRLSVAQWIDYQSFAKDLDKYMVELASVVLVPKGKTYNEGYDMKALQRDLGEMEISDALSVCFFFQKRWLKSMRITLTFLVGKAIQMKNKEMRQRALEVRKEVSALLSSL